MGCPLPGRRVMTMRRLVVGLFCTAFLGVGLAFGTGSVALVETHGNSMAPRITAGDRVIVRESTHGVGDVVAYTSADLRQMVLHRVVSVKDGRFTPMAITTTSTIPSNPRRRNSSARNWFTSPRVASGWTG